MKQFMLRTVGLFYGCVWPEQIVFISRMHSCLIKLSIERNWKCSLVPAHLFWKKDLFQWPFRPSRVGFTEWCTCRHRRRGGTPSPLHPTRPDHVTCVTREASVDADMRIRLDKSICGTIHLVIFLQASDADTATRFFRHTQKPAPFVVWPSNQLTINWIRNRAETGLFYLHHVCIHQWKLSSSVAFHDLHIIIPHKSYPS